MSERAIERWFADYATSHQNPTNKKIHFICVPTIFFTVVGLLWSIPVPALFAPIPYLNWATLAMLLVLAYYLRLSVPLALGMLLFTLLCIGMLSWMSAQQLPVLWISLGIFVVAWIGQFVGHEIEGKKPSFFKDLQYLMIGPAWVLGYLFRRAGIRY